MLRRKWYPPILGAFFFTRIPLLWAWAAWLTRISLL